jgi:SAM-dependent methyltransferase
MLRCLDCEFRFYERGLSETEAANLYAHYRSEEYQRERQKDEPFYTEKAHAGFEAFENSPLRRRSLERKLAELGIGPLDSALDYGGADGRLIAELPAKRKAVYDIAGTPPVEGVEAVRADELRNDWDLIVCAQTLEHISDPLDLVRRLLALVRPGGHLYLEVPAQLWKNKTFAGALRDGVLRLALRHRWLHIALDVYSTAFRIKAGILPPFGLVPMREHLNFFSAAALEALARRAGGEVVDCGDDPLSGIVAAVRRP